MDTHNPRWQTSEARFKHSATVWKVIAGATAASALTAAIVASCLGRDEARRIADEPASVETTAGAPAQPQAAAPRPANATGTDDGRMGNDSVGTTQTTGGTLIVPATPTIINNTTNITTPSPVDVSGSQQQPQSNSVQSGAPAVVTYSVKPEPLSPVVTTNGSTDANDPNARTANPPGGPVAGHASHANNDPNNRDTPPPFAGSNPDSPSMSAGAGPFTTEAPYWGSSAWQSNPNAGAGPFTTERNTPAR